MSDLLAPGFLTAFPHLIDANFRQSVVLLLQQDDQGAIGVVINRESSLLVRELCRDHKIPYAGDAKKHVRTGGPVQPEQGLVIYGNEHKDPDGQRLFDGINVSSSRETLARLCNLDRGRFHCYSGYAGWGAGQLEREIGDGSWLVSPADPTLIFETDPGGIWNGSMRAMGIDPASLVSGGSQEA